MGGRVMTGANDGPPGSMPIALITAGLHVPDLLGNLPTIEVYSLIWSLEPTRMQLKGSFTSVALTIVNGLSE
ncbi:unnamed protein product [Nippostrongylus brasiliensis]|uniref:BPI2 domain-containing protein n=1 Tax=Nippostrongylus brasiliensis TaxID=27835 RepID=A0A0N4XDU8_NIPBR|nr:unnamed protein product [Nippostrongylus brasiliensis]